MDKILVVYPSFLAGMGPATWLWGVLEIVKTLGKENNIPVVYVGPKLDVNGIEIIPKGKALEKVSSIQENYIQLKNLLEPAIDGVKDIAIISLGYTSYTSWALKKLLKKNQRAILMVLDSSPPDTDSKSEEVDENNIPTSRFHWPSYKEEKNLRQYLYLFSTYQYNTGFVKGRIPNGMSGVVNGVIVGRHPYSKSLEMEIQNFNSPKREEIVVPIICAGDYWDEKAVGEWMTSAQYNSMKIGTLNLIEALGMVASKLGQEVFVPIDEMGLRFIKKNRSIPKNISFEPFSNLPQQKHWALMKSASLIIARGGNQTNAIVAATLMQVPFLFWNVPGYKYMQTWETNLEAMQSYLMEGFDWNENPKVITSKIFKAINGEGIWKNRPELLLKAYEETPTLHGTLKKVFNLW